MGNNVGLYNPYAAAYEPPPEDSGVIDFGNSVYGSGGGSVYNGVPFGRQYSMNGLPVTEAYFMDIINSGMVGGAFGLLEMSARMSAQFAGYSVRTSHGTIERNYGNDFNRAAGEALESGSMTVYRNFTVNESWSIVASLIPLALQTQTQTQQYEPLPSKEQFKKLLTNRQNLNNGDCRKFLESVIANLGLSKKLKIGGTMEDLFDYLTGKKNIGFERDDQLAGTQYGGFSGHTAKGPIRFRPSPESKSDSTKYFYQMSYVGVLVHEMFHRALKDGTHGKFAKAAFGALSVDEQNEIGKPSGSDTDRSNYFSKIFNSKCKFNQNNTQEVKANLVP